MQITERDIAILKFINEFGFCEISQLQQRFGLKIPRSYKIIQRLIKAGLVIHERILHGRHGIYRLSKDGAAHTDLPPLDKVYLGTYYHQLMVIEVFMQLAKRHPQATWISERQLIQDKFKKYKIGLGQYGHLADGALLFPDNKQIAIEVELTLKGSWRLEKIISNYITDFDFQEVWYFCAPQVMQKLNKAAKGYESFVKVFSLHELIY